MEVQILSDPVFIIKYSSSVFFWFLAFLSLRCKAGIAIPHILLAPEPQAADNDNKSQIL